MYPSQSLSNYILAPHILIPSVMIHGAICGQIMRDNNPRIAIKACMQQFQCECLQAAGRGRSYTRTGLAPTHPLLKLDPADLGMTRGPSDITPPAVLNYRQEGVGTQSRKESQATGLKAEHRKPAEPQESTHLCLLSRLDEWTVDSPLGVTKGVSPSKPE